ncbi:D-alanyl-D-alanine carboxypeptidase family protein [Mesobacillus zeae]|uniref:D-alanyl-D-alanine carboxypeptidase n=1 Tax=Mesobacillus zeae TaxID=1917180 RepID=A0A398B6M5_9BACI|nr:D-alanyl-D-alanine carboxypeptidase family protein [Mesobacillus zeae]RID85595.1 D-alanyl-D-alanine carboxypeptidase [Mesobacillus zeae]
MIRKAAIYVVLLFYFAGAASASAGQKGEPKVASEGAILMDSQSGTVLYQKNADKRMNPASLTKIATAIYAIESGNLDDTVIVSGNAANVEGTRVYLAKGEKIQLRKLLQGMMVNSGNDAAIAVAEHLDGTVEQFSVNINKYLKEKVGVENTHFSNPSGLYSVEHYTTARDLGEIVNYAEKNAFFEELFGIKELPWTGAEWNTVLKSHHKMVLGEIPYQYVTGGKTGFIDESKQTLATAADNGRIKMTAVLLKAETKKEIYEDTITLFDYGFHHFRTSKIEAGTSFKKKNQMFIADESVFITEPLSGAEQKLNGKGILKIKDREGQIVQSVKLEEVLKKGTAAKQITEEKTKKSSIFNAGNCVAGAVMIGTLYLWMLNRKLRKSRNRLK